MVAPTVTAVSPNTGLTLGGEVVNVSGTGFSVSPPSVAFGPYAGYGIVVQSDTFLSVISPVAINGAGAVNIVVTTTAGSSATSGASVFTYSFPLGDGVDYINTNPFLDLFANYTVYGQWTFALAPNFSGGSGSFASISVSGLATVNTFTASGLAAQTPALAAAVGANAPSHVQPAGWATMIVNTTTGVVGYYVQA